MLRNTLATVTYTGTVKWTSHQVFRSSCSIDVTNFPFDTQLCHMWFGSWTHSTRYLDLYMAFRQGIDINTFQSDYKDSSEWTIENVSAVRQVLPPDDEPNFTVLEFSLELKRKQVFASYILTLPCVFLACLTLVVFWLPPERPDRTSLAMNLFASFLLLLLILVEAAPPTASSVPSLGIYYCFNLVIIMLAIFLSSLVVNISRIGHTRRHVPVWLRQVITGTIGRLLLIWPVGPALRMEYEDEEDDEDWVSMEQLNTCDMASLREAQRLQHSQSNIPLLMYQNDRQSDNRTDGFEKDLREHLTGLGSQITAIKKLVQRIDLILSQRPLREAYRRCFRREWRSVAMLLDRIFFIIYVIAIVTSLATLFPRR